MTRRLLAAIVLPFATACASNPPQLAPFPHGEAIQLLEGPVHLGDGRADGQDFIQGATSARLCSLVNMPRTADVYLQARDVRHTETLSNVLTVNGRAFPLPITMERDPHDVTSNGMSVSPIERVRLDQGPSEICLVAGQKTNGDIDDFEVAQLTMFVEGVETRDIGVRRGLSGMVVEGTRPPSRTAGTSQAWPPPVPAWSWPQYQPQPPPRQAALCPGPMGMVPCR